MDFIARGGQIIDATMVPALRQHHSRGEKNLVGTVRCQLLKKPAKRGQKDRDATWTKKLGKSHFGCKLPVHVDKQKSSSARSRAVNKQAGPKVAGLWN